MAGRPRKVNRPERTPISGHRNIMAVKGIPEGYVGRWVNDIDDRITRYLDAGYSFVTDKALTVGDRTVNNSDDVGTIRTKNVGNGIVAYLMAQPKEYYDEDKRAIHNEINALEDSITKRREHGQYGSVEIANK